MKTIASAMPDYIYYIFQPYRERQMLLDALKSTTTLCAFTRFPMNSLRYLLPFVLASSLWSAAAKADESLMDKAHAEKLTPAQKALLGPKSGSLRYDARMIRAVEIAKRRAHPKMTWHCWKYVKDALLAAQVVGSRPKSVFANHAGAELCNKYGFTKLPIHDPYQAPVGAIVVYDGADGGHVEIRTEDGFVSDFESRTAYPRPVLGVYVKPS
jgi:hypothetical protein